MEEIEKAIEKNLSAEECARLVDFIETHGLDLSKEEKESLSEAREDWKNGNKEAFTSMEDLRTELSI